MTAVRTHRNVRAGSASHPPSAGGSKRQSPSFPKAAALADLHAGVAGGGAVESNSILRRASWRRVPRSRSSAEQFTRPSDVPLPWCAGVMTGDEVLQHFGKAFGRPLAADALHADARAFAEEKDFVREEFGLREPRLAT